MTNVSKMFDGLIYKFRTWQLMRKLYKLKTGQNLIVDHTIFLDKNCKIIRMDRKIRITKIINGDLV